MGQERGGGCSAGQPSVNWLKKCHLNSEILTQVLGDALLPGWGCQWSLGRYLCSGWLRGDVCIPPCNGDP